MSVTKSRKDQDLEEWLKLFPANVTQNYTSSVTFMKQLTVVAVSTITYLRNSFPEDSYMVQSFGGLKLKVLKQICKDELAQFLSDALTNAFEAFDKKYLHQLALCFYKNNYGLENLIEYYMFEYTYNPDGVTMNIHTKQRGKEVTKITMEDVQNKTINLLRSCLVIIQTCSELPINYDLSVRLYYNDEAPEGYQAPGFCPGNDETDHLDGTSRDPSNYIKMGKVETPYHKLMAWSYSKEIMKSSHEAIPSQTAPEFTQQWDLASEHDSNNQGTTYNMRCPCNNYKDIVNYKPPVTITCMCCNTRQHAVCFGRVGGAGAGRAHVCCYCADAGAGAPSDARLAQHTSHKHRESLCIYRRTLALCTELQSIDGAIIMDMFDIGEENAFKLLRLLESQKIIAKCDNAGVTTPRPINVDSLKATMGELFHINDEPDLAERLLAETLSQRSESEPDPLGDVLSPLERVSLQNTSQLGRVVPNTRSTRADSTMKEFREVIMRDSDSTAEELPLSGSHNPVRDLDKLVKVKSLKRNVEGKSEQGKPKTGVTNKKVKRRVDQ